MLKTLSLETLADLDGGRIQAAVDRELAHINRDLEDRPALNKARKLTIEISATPYASESGGRRGMGGAKVVVKVKSSVPDRQSKDFDMIPTQDGLGWNELSPEDARQLTIDDAHGGPRRAVPGGAPKTQQSKEETA